MSGFANVIRYSMHGDINEADRRKNQSKAVMLVYVCGNLIMLRIRDAQGIEVELL